MLPGPGPHTPAPHGQLPGSPTRVEGGKHGAGRRGGCAPAPSPLSLGPSRGRGETGMGTGTESGVEGEGGGGMEMEMG